jgi:hypothetical protein
MQQQYILELEVQQKESPCNRLKTLIFLSQLPFQASGLPAKKGPKRKGKGKRGEKLVKS